MCAYASLKWECTNSLFILHTFRTGRVRRGHQPRLPQFLRSFHVPQSDESDSENLHLNATVYLACAHECSLYHTSGQRALARKRASNGCRTHARPYTYYMCMHTIRACHIK
jgi:hypothetical protein